MFTQVIKETSCTTGLAFALILIGTAYSHADVCSLPASSLSRAQLMNILENGCTIPLSASKTANATTGRSNAPGGISGSTSSGSINVGIGGATKNNMGGLNLGLGSNAASRNSSGINAGVGTAAASRNTGGLNVGLGRDAATNNTGGINADVGGPGAGSDNRNGLGVGIGGRDGLGVSASSRGIGASLGGAQIGNP